MKCLPFTFSLLGLFMFWGCESTETVQVNPGDGILKRSNPAAVLNGKDVQFSGLVQVYKVGQRTIPAPSFGTLNQAQSKIPVEEGPCLVTLESSFNRDGEVFLYQGDLSITVEPGGNYYPVAGLEAISGKAWMWIQDFDKDIRVSDRVEASLVRRFIPAEENYVDIYQYESIIDPDVMAERRAACDITSVAGYMPDESLDRGDLSASRRE